MKSIFLALILITPIFSLAYQMPDPSAIAKYLSQYSSYEMKFDASGYNANDKLLLKKLIEASEYLDTLFWLQSSKYGLRMRDSLAQHATDTQGKNLLILVNRNAGPFELLNDYAAFAGDQKYYAGHEFYPAGMTSGEFDEFVSKLPKKKQDAFMSPYTVIRRDGKGGYIAIPYHQEYKKYITLIARLLKECAKLSDNKSFSKFLTAKAKGLETDNYYDADVAWIEMERTKFDMVFGPFETYADEIKGVKAKYEANIEVVDQEESKKLEMYKSHLSEMEENLPIPAEYKSVVKGLTAKFVIVRDIVRKGESISGYQAVATNLPNDPVVQEKKGSVKTFWKNMFEARFNAIIRPVSMILIDSSQRQYLSDEGFFLDVLMHEICHALGPKTVKVGPNKGMAVNASIGPDYSALEENKADMAGLHSFAMLIDKGVIDKSMQNKVYVSFLGSLFRSVRFGLNEAHGKAAAIELNYLWKNGSVIYDAQKKTWTVNLPAIREGVKNLARELLLLEGNGDGKKVKEFCDAWTYMTPELQSSLEAVKNIAIDVIPHYSIQW